jgi:hypothetical protein
MTNDQILRKAVEKVTANGWTDWKRYVPAFPKTGKSDAGLTAILRARTNDIIFSHDFAKAFFGEKDEWYTTDCTCGGVDFHIAGSHDAHKLDCAKVRSSRGYLFHLKEMVVEKEPLKYIQRFL